jgi:hypothetical protein
MLAEMARINGINGSAEAAAVRRSPPLSFKRAPPLSKKPRTEWGKERQRP